MYVCEDPFCNTIVDVNIPPLEATLDYIGSNLAAFSPSSLDWFLQLLGDDLCSTLSSSILAEQGALASGVARNDQVRISLNLFVGAGINVADTGKCEPVTGVWV